MLRELQNGKSNAKSDYLVMVISDVGGSYPLLLSTDTYTLEVLAPGFSSSSTIITIAAGEVKTEGFHLDLCIPIKGTIYGKGNKNRWCYWYT